MNSAIHILSHTQPLTDYLVKRTLTPEQENSVAGHYIDLIKKLREPGGDKIDPSAFRAKGALTVWPDMETGQQDSVFFLDHLIGTILETFPEASKFIEANTVYTITCLACKDVEKRRNKQSLFFSEFPLFEDSKKAIIPLEDCFDDCFKKEKQNTVCNVCKNQGHEYQNSLQGSKLPSVLIIALLRMDADDLIFNQTRTPFPLDLTLKNGYFDQPPAKLPTYKLRGLVLRSGNFHGGHITALVRDDTVLNTDQQWAYFDDLSGPHREHKTIEEIKKIASDGKYLSFSPMYFVYERVLKPVDVLIDALEELKARLIDLKNKIATLSVV